MNPVTDRLAGKPIRRAVISATLMGLLGTHWQALAEPTAAAKPGSPALALVEAAREQVGVTVRYDGSYQRLDYPMGDVAEETGVCTDVIIRALRRCGHDLQKLVHEDMRRAFPSYPQNWGLSRPDRNIDHRRVPNLKRYFFRQQMRLPLPADPAAALDRFKPGDFVTCTVPPHLPHIMIISDRTNARGVPLVIHNIGRGTREEDRLLSFPLTGHYRWFSQDAASNP